MLKAVIMLAAVLVSTSGWAEEWRRYSNERYGFSLDVPGQFTPSAKPANGDGLTFTAPDGLSVIRTYGHALATANDLATDQRAQLGQEEDGFGLTYRHVDRRGSVYSGLTKTSIVYMRSVPTCSGAAAAVLRVEYGAGEKARFDPFVTHMARSLHGSDHCM